MYNIIQTRKVWFFISGSLMVASIVFLVLGGLKLGIDFTGGSRISLEFESRPEIGTLENTIKSLNLGDIKIQPVGSKQVVIKTKHLNNDEKNQLVSELENEYGSVTEQSFESIGPIIGRELQTKAVVAIAVVLVAIIAYISWAFRKVSQGPVSSWIYGLGAIIALFHDILIVTGLFAALGYFMQVEIDSLFVTALLTILGFSVHDTIVVYDRIRENIKHHSRQPFATVMNQSINQTMIRSLNTSMTVLLVLLVLYLFGGQSLQYFLLALIAGVIVGTYSSIFIASPFLLEWHLAKTRRSEKSRAAN